MKIDTHSHAIPKEIVDIWRKEPMKYGYRLEETPDGILKTVDRLDKRGALYKGLYDVKTRLADLNARGVDAEVITPSPETIIYNMPIGETLGYNQKVNDAVVAMCREAPDRLFPAGTLPVHDVSAACTELKRIVKEYNIHLVQVGTSVNGLYYDEPEFLPLFQLCEELEVMILFHPRKFFTGVTPGPYYLTNLLGNPLDTTVSAARIVLGGVLKKCPRSKLLFSHGGGYLPYQRGRIEHGFRMREDVRAGLGDTDPAEYLDELYFDTITHSSKALAYLITTQGPDHIILGSDYPWDMADVRNPDEILDLPDLGTAEKEKILSQNILKILKKKSLTGSNLVIY